MQIEDILPPKNGMSKEEILERKHDKELAEIDDPAELEALGNKGDAMALYYLFLRTYKDEQDRARKLLEAKKLTGQSLIDFLHEDRFHAKSLAYLRKSAELGYGQALYILATRLMKNEKDKIVYERGFKLLCRACDECHHGKALFKRALAYQEQSVLKCDSSLLPLAVADLIAAKDKGNRDAVYLLGACYRDGYGVPRDDEKAEALLAWAMNHGDREAMYDVIEMVVTGRIQHGNYEWAEKQLKERNLYDFDHEGRAALLLVELLLDHPEGQAPNWRAVRHALRKFEGREDSPNYPMAMCLLAASEYYGAGTKPNLEKAFAYADACYSWFWEQIDNRIPIWGRCYIRCYKLMSELMNFIRLQEPSLCEKAKKRLTRPPEFARDDMLRPPLGFRVHPPEPPEPGMHNERLERQWEIDDPEEDFPSFLVDFLENE